MATFVVERTLRLSRRPGLFLVGDIKNGTVRKGMIVRGCLERGIQAVIASVDFIDPGGHVTLHIRLDNPKDEARVQEVCHDGQVIELIEDTPPTP